VTKGKLSLIAASIAVATGLFWAKMLVAPPVTEAATYQGIDTAQVALNAPKNLPSFDAAYQRHVGVLDTLETR
jgi:hypothetical protein